MQPTQATLVSVREAIASKSISTREVVQAYLDRIDQLNPSLNAYNQIFHEDALARAEAVDRGEVTGALAGVPISVKDLFCMTQGRTTCSSKMLGNYESPFTATSIAKLEQAGAIVLGKTVMDEFAMGSSCEHSVTGPSVNPWDADRVAGGSSGGAATSMSADLCAAAMGTDTGGSIRQPAAFCGVVGLKPTYGRVSRYGMVAFASSLDQTGPLTRTVEDAAVMLKVISGQDALDSTSAHLPVPEDLDQVDAPVNDGGKLRIGIAKQYTLEGANSPGVDHAMEASKEAMIQAGANIVEVDLPHTQLGIPVYYLVAPAEASSNLARYDGVHFGHRTQESLDNIIDLYAKSRSEGFGDEVKRRIMLGTYALSSGYYDAYYLRAMKVRRLIKQDFDEAFENVDAILCPTTTGPAFRCGEKQDDLLAMYLNDVYTVNANLAGIPALSMPAGFETIDDKPLPIGVQLLGKPFDETNLLRIAYQLEQGLDLQNARPSLA